MVGINHNRVKERLECKEKVLGAWAQAASNITVEVMADSNIDLIILDMEHSPADLPVLVSQIQAMNGYSAVPFVRTPWNDPVIIKRVLDAGAYGVLIPYVETRQEAMAAVAAVKFPPMGKRGIAGSARAAHFNHNPGAYFSRANEEIMVFIQIETVKGCEHIDEILSVEDLDGALVGPYDLSTNMGFLGNTEAPEVTEVIRTIESKIKESGKYLLTLASDTDETVRKFRDGAHIVMCMSDTQTLGMIARQNVRAFKEMIGM